MTIFKTLLSIHFLQLYNPKAPKNIKKILLYGFVLVVLGGYLFAYCFLAARFLSQAGLLSLLPAAVFTLGSIMMIISSCQQVRGSLQHYRDETFLFALPIPHKAIYLSRWLFIYLCNLAILLVILIPCMIAMHIYGHFAISFYLRLLPLFPFAPFMPMAIGMVAGLLIEAIARRFANSRIISIVLTFAFVFVLYYYIFNISAIEDATTILALISSMLAGIYPLSRLFIAFLCDSQIGHLVVYMLLSLGALLVMTGLTKCYPAIQNIKSAKKAKAKLQVKNHQSSVLGALFQKEWRRYFSSVPYVTNTAIAYVLLLGVAVYLQFQDIEPLLVYLEMLSYRSMIVWYIPFMIGFIIAIGTTSACAISMEGKNFWQLQVLPLQAKTIFQAKILLNLSLSLPSVSLAILLLGRALQCQLSDIAMIWLLSSLYALLFSQLGLLFNLALPHLTWDNETKAVKQGMAILLVLLASLLLCALPITFMITTKIDPVLIRRLMILVMILLNILVARYLNGPAGEKKFRSIYA